MTDPIAEAAEEAEAADIRDADYNAGVAPLGQLNREAEGRRQDLLTVIEQYRSVLLRSASESLSISEDMGTADEIEALEADIVSAAVLYHSAVQLCLNRS